MAAAGGPGRGAVSDLDTIGRCKQCGAPVTEFNKVMGPTGMFCSDECKQRHEHFVKRAAATDESRSSAKFGVKALIVSLIKKVVVLGIVVVILAGLILYLNVPVVSDIVRSVGIFNWMVGWFPAS